MDQSRVIQEITQSLSQRLDALELQRHPIGAVMQCFLTEEQFGKQMGSGWVPCDGREVKDSQYHRLGFGEHVPDCRGQFLRTLGPGSSGLKEQQGQGTAINGLKVASSAGETVAKTVFKVKWNDKDWVEDRTPYFFPGWSTVTIHQYKGQIQEFIEVGSTKAPFDTSLQNQPHTHAITTTVSGDGETRPTNIVINTFIRIN